MMEATAERSTTALTPRQDLFEIFAHNDFSLKKKKKIIDALDDIDGFELSFLISFILSMDITGHLNIISKTNEVIGVSFSHGFITHIDLPDRQTYFGTLMVEQGLVQAKDLEAALRQTELHIGQYFLKQKIVTQQQLDHIFRKQMELRLAKLICDNTYNINFADAAETPLFIKITRKDYYEMCYHWLESRFSDQWLVKHYATWADHLVIFLDGHTYITEAFKKKLLADLPDFEREIRKGLRLNHLTELYHSKQNEFFKALFFLNMIGVVVFHQSPDVEKISKLETIYLQLKDLKGKELAKAISELTRMPAHQTESMYLAFLKLISENTDDASQEYKNHLVKIAIDFLGQQSNELTTTKAVGQTPRAQMEINIAQNAINIIQNELLRGKYFEAFGQLKKAFLGNDITPSMKVYLLWAKVGHALTAGLKVNLTNFENELEDLSADDKATAEFEYIQSMLCKLKGNLTGSQKHYEIAVKKKALFLKYPLNQSMWTKIKSSMGLKS